jgi:uncharacterized protein YkwD
MINLRFRCVGLALAAVVFGLAPGPGAARAETYNSFATRLAHGLPDGATFRPDLEEVLANAANAFRLQQGKTPLRASDLFLVPARAHAADMMLHNFIGHRASTGHDFDSRMRAFAGDITRFPAMAENAARESQKSAVNAAKARHLFQQWVDSRSHRKALVSRDYAFVSTAVVQRGSTIWAVQIFWAAPREKGIFQ